MAGGYTRIYEIKFDFEWDSIDLLDMKNTILILKDCRLGIIDGSVVKLLNGKTLPCFNTFTRRDIPHFEKAIVFVKDIYGDDYIRLTKKGRIVTI